MSSSDYNYDQAGEFYPFFVFTLAAIVTLPLTYNVLKGDGSSEQTAPRLDYGYEIPDDKIREDSKRRAKRKQRKLKRIITVVLGYALMIGMVYLIIVTQRVLPRVYDPYEILGVSRVSPASSMCCR